MTSIGGLAFDYCSRLTSIIVAEGNAKYDSRNGCNAIIETSSNTLIVGCSSTVIPESVTSIGGRAFYNCRSLTSITIPEGVTSIGSSAFYYCSSLTSITIHENSRLTSIGDEAFHGCSSLTSITIPESVTSIRGNAFYDCSSLTSVHIKDIASWCNIDFTITPYYSVYDSNPLYYANNLYLNGELVTELTIPNTVTAIKSYAFYNCSCLTSITIPEGVTSIGEDAFYGCSSLRKVINFSNLNISKGSSSHGYVAYYAEKVITADEAIDKYCFRTSKESTHYLVGYYGNDSILNLPEDYHGDDYIIGTEAFADDTRIVSVNIPQTVGKIGASAFARCSKLVSVTIPRGVMSIGDNAFENCSSLAAIVIPQNMLAIGSKSFAGCSSLSSVEFKEGVETIGNNAFANCTSLATLIFPESLTAIGDEAFKGCSGLKTILFSENIDAYGSNVFEGCDEVETMTVKGSVMPTVPSDKITSITLYSPVPLETAEFANKVYRNATVYVPQGSLERYWAANVWKNFWTIKEFDPTGIEQLTINNGQLTIYDLSGRKIEVDDLRELEKGVYVVNGRKVVINNK